MHNGGSLLATDRSKAVMFGAILSSLFGVGVSCRSLYSIAI